MLPRFMRLVPLAVAVALPAAAQSAPDTPQPPNSAVQTGDVTVPQLSPGAAYREAVRPVELTRAAVSNWSDIEQASLAVAIKQGAQACSTRRPADYTGAALVDLGRLCALGFSWPAAATAAGQYIHEDAAPKPRLAEAYSVLINAELQLKDEVGAFKQVQAMLSGLPYTSLNAASSTQAIDYMRLIFTSDAVLIAEKRQPLVLTALRTPAPAVGEGTDAVPAVPDLYNQGLALAELQQLRGQSSAAIKTIDELESALPPGMSADDVLAIQGSRLRYELIGKPLPEIRSLAHSLTASMQTSSVPAHNAITVLLLFPDWCAQCVRLAAQVPVGVFAVEHHNAYMFGLLAQTVPQESAPKPHGKSDPPIKQSFDPAYAAESLRGTPTLAVPASLLDIFHATGFPLLIVTDNSGVVRLLEVANETALQPGDTVDSAVALIGRQQFAPSK